MRHPVLTGSRLLSLAAVTGLATLMLSGTPAVAQITAVKLDARVTTGPGTRYVAVTVGGTPSVALPAPAAQAADQYAGMLTVQDQYMDPPPPNWEDGTMLAIALADPSFAAMAQAPATPPVVGGNCRLVNVTFSARDLMGKAAKSPVKVTGEPVPTTCIPLNLTWKIALAVSEVTEPTLVSMTISDPTAKQKTVQTMVINPIVFALSCQPASRKAGGAGKGTITLTAKSATAKTVAFQPDPSATLPAIVTVKPGALTADFTYKLAPAGERSPPTIKAAPTWNKLRPRECQLAMGP